MFDPPEWPSFLLFWCVFTWFTSRSQFVSAHSMNNSQTFFHGSASLWLGLMHLFALPQPPLTMPRFSLWMMSKPINPDCVMVKASKSDNNVSQIVYHGSSCLSLSDSTLPPKHKPHPVLVLLSMNHQLPCVLPEIWRFSHTYAKYQRCISGSKIRKCFQFHPNFGVRHQSPLSFPLRICWLRFRLAKPENIRGRMPFLLPCVATVQSLLRRAFRITTRSTFAVNPIDVVEPVFVNVSMITHGLACDVCLVVWHDWAFISILLWSAQSQSLRSNFQCHASSHKITNKLLWTASTMMFYVWWTKIIRTDKDAISHPQKLLIRWHYSKKPSFRKNHDC